MFVSLSAEGEVTAPMRPSTEAKLGQEVSLDPEYLSFVPRDHQSHQVI